MAPFSGAPTSLTESQRDMVSARLTPMTVHAAANLSSTAPSVVPGRVSNTPMEPLLRYSVHWRMATVGIGIRN